MWQMYDNEISSKSFHWFIRQSGSITLYLYIQIVQVVSISGLIDRYVDYLAAVIPIVRLVNPFECNVKERKGDKKWGIQAHLVYHLYLWRHSSSIKTVNSRVQRQGRNYLVFMIWIYILEYLRWLGLNIYTILELIYLTLFNCYQFIFEYYNLHLCFYFLCVSSVSLSAQFFCIYSPVACVSVIRLESSTIAPSSRRAFFNISITTATTRKKLRNFCAIQKRFFS